MSQRKDAQGWPIRLRWYVALLAALWTLAVGAVFVSEWFDEQGHLLNTAREEARAVFEKDLLVLRWNAAHGGVYVPVTGRTPPNPHLAHLGERDLATASGRSLTLINPADMTRQIHEFLGNETGLRAHLTSLNLVRLENAPDTWEAEALEAFEQGATEVSSVAAVDGQDYLRVMRPMFTEEACLKCHAAQGYRLGQIRGGISVSVPLAPLRREARSGIRRLLLGYGSLWLLGLGIALGTARRLNQQIKRRCQAEADLRRARDELDLRVQVRTADLAQANQRLRQEVADRELAEHRLLESNATLEERVVERTAVAESRAAQLRELACKLTQTEHRERRRLAQVLHDHLQQLLVAARLKVGLLSRRVADRDLGDRLCRVDQLLAQAIDASRGLTLQLSPPILHDAGLIAALHWLARQMEEKHGLAVEIVADETAEPETADLRFLLFEAVRELLFNVVKHAGTESATVAVERTAQDEIQVTVQDEGQGFDAAALGSSGRGSGGFGLFSVRERIEWIGGRARVESAPGQGTRVTLVAPLATTPSDAPGPTTPSSANASPGTPSAAKRSDLQGQRRIRVLVADDHEIFREGLSRLLAELPDLEVAGEASDGLKAVEMALEQCPDVVLMDAVMPGLGGAEACRRITAALPQVRVIGLSMHDDPSVAAAMRDAGAVAFLCKDGSTDALLATIRGEAQALAEPFPSVVRSPLHSTRS